MHDLIIFTPRSISPNWEDFDILESLDCRIVLERPEYGYATYFFELVDSLPIEWQIKRLVTAMKLTSCSRLSLIENKALTVTNLETYPRSLMIYG